MIDPQKLQVLLDVLQRAPCGLAERLICQEVVDQLIMLSKGSSEATARKAPPPTGRAHDE